MMQSPKRDLLYNRGSIFRFHAASWAHDLQMARTFLQQTPRMNMSSGLLLRIQSFRERGRESLLEQYLPGKRPLLLIPINFTPITFVLQIGKLSSTIRLNLKHAKTFVAFGWINQLPFGVGRLSYFLLAEGFPRSRIFVFSEDHPLRGLSTQWNEVDWRWCSFSTWWFFLSSSRWFCQGFSAFP